MSMNQVTIMIVVQSLPTVTPLWNSGHTQKFGGQLDISQMTVI